MGGFASALRAMFVFQKSQQGISEELVSLAEALTRCYERKLDRRANRCDLR
jgi:hypothetical protein